MMVVVNSRHVGLFSKTKNQDCGRFKKRSSRKNPILLAHQQASIVVAAYGGFCLLCRGGWIDHGALWLLWMVAFT
jgi:hypothetical protein